MMHFTHTWRKQKVFSTLCYDFFLMTFEVFECFSKFGHSKVCTTFRRKNEAKSSHINSIQSSRWALLCVSFQWTLERFVKQLPCILSSSTTNQTTWH